MPRPPAEPTRLRDILQDDPLASRLREETERREEARQNGTATQFGPGLYTLGETRGMRRAAEEFIVDGGILTKGGKLLLYAGHGVGKTTMLDHLAACLAAGQPYLGRFSVDRARRVLFVQAELSAPELASHGQDLLDNFDATGAVDGLVFWLQTQMKLPRDLDLLMATIRATAAEILILDPFIRFFNGQNTVQPEEVNALFEAVDKVLQDPALGVEAAIVTHHMNVAQARTAGAWAFEAWPATIVRLDRVKGRQDCRSLTFEKVRSPDSDLYGRMLVIRLGDDGYLVDSAALDNIRPDARGVACLTDFLRASGGEAWRKDAVAHLKTVLGVHERQTTNIIGSAVGSGLVLSTKVGREVRLGLVGEVDRD